MKKKRKRRRTRPTEREGTKRAAARASQLALPERTMTSSERAASEARTLLNLQQNLGNQAVQRLLHSGTIQTQPVSLAPQAGTTAQASYDMGKPVGSASEAFYNINEPNLAKIGKKFKFADKDGSKLAGETMWKVRTRAIPKGGITKKGGMWVVDAIPWFIKSIDVELPKWQNFSTAKDADRKEWARFIKCTRIHEQGHVDRVRKLVNKEMPKGWKSARAPTLKALKQRLKELVRLVGDRLTQIGEAYDVQTGHGATQGATLKPPTLSP